MDYILGYVQEFSSIFFTQQKGGLGMDMKSVAIKIELGRHAF